MWSQSSNVTDGQTVTYSNTALLRTYVLRVVKKPNKVHAGIFYNIRYKLPSEVGLVKDILYFGALACFIQTVLCYANTTGATHLHESHSKPVARESGANTHPWPTTDSIVNQALSDWDARAQLIELLYKALISLISSPESRASSGVIKATISWVNQRQHANRHWPHMPA